MQCIHFQDISLSSYIDENLKFKQQNFSERASKLGPQKHFQKDDNSLQRRCFKVEMCGTVEILPACERCDKKFDREIVLIALQKLSYKICQSKRFLHRF